MKHHIAIHNRLYLKDYRSNDQYENLNNFIPNASCKYPQSPFSFVRLDPIISCVQNHLLLLPRPSRLRETSGSEDENEDCTASIPWIYFCHEFVDHVTKRNRSSGDEMDSSTSK